MRGDRISVHQQWDGQRPSRCSPPVARRYAHPPLVASIVAMTTAGSTAKATAVTTSETVLCPIYGV